MKSISLLFQGLFAFSQVPESLKFSYAAYHIKHCQEKKLFDYLKKNKATRFGREHGFADIHTLEAYRNQVPIRTYRDFLPYIEAIRQGQHQVLTAESDFFEQRKLLFVE